MYSAKGYVSWLAKLKKADKRKAQLVMRGTSEGRILDLSPGVVGRAAEPIQKKWGAYRIKPGAR